LQIIHHKHMFKLMDQLPSTTSIKKMTRDKHVLLTLDAIIYNVVYHQWHTSETHVENTNAAFAEILVFFRLSVEP